MRAFVNADIYTEHGVASRHALLVERGRVAGVVPLAELNGSVAVTDLDGACVLPGYVDLQVNGGGGVLFNDEPTLAGLQAIAAAHRGLGTTSILPTFVTGPQDAMESAIESVRQAVAAGMPGILGIHLEGPSINPARAGAHNRSLIRELDPRWLAGRLQGIPSLVTLAPETVQPSYVRTLAESGVRVAIGHSDATGDDAERAAREGASLVTHLYNGCSQLTGREPGVVGIGLAMAGLAVSCIADGQHVAFRSVEAAIRAKPAGRFLLISDAMPVVGSGLSEFDLEGLHVTVRNGRCEAADGRLAGSALVMAQAVRNCVRQVGVPTQEAIRMASLYPARYLGQSGSVGSLAAGTWADAVVADSELNVRGVIMRGELL